MPSLFTGTISKDSKILILKTREQKRRAAKKMLKKFAVKQWCNSGL